MGCGARENECRSMMMISGGVHRCCVCVCGVRVHRGGRGWGGWDCGSAMVPSGLGLPRLFSKLPALMINVPISPMALACSRVRACVCMCVCILTGVLVCVSIFQRSPMIHSCISCFETFWGVSCLKRGPWKAKGGHSMGSWSYPKLPESPMIHDAL